MQIKGTEDVREERQASLSALSLSLSGRKMRTSSVRGLSLQRNATEPNAIRPTKNVTASADFTEAHEECSFEISTKAILKFLSHITQKHAGFIHCIPKATHNRTTYWTVKNFPI